MFLYVPEIFRKQGGKAVKRGTSAEQNLCHGCMNIMTELLVLYGKVSVRNGSVC